MAKLAQLGLVVLFASALSAQQLPPRDIWPQATAAAKDGEVETARKRSVELLDTGKAYGLKTYPTYAVSAAAMAREAEREGNKGVADWATAQAAQLDPKSPGVAFSQA